jgi:hypothetical protein
MIKVIFQTCLGRKVKFYSNHWNGYEIEAGHEYQTIRFYFPFNWLPYFWDNDIAFDIGVRIPKLMRANSDKWSYHWELRDLDGQVVKQADKSKQGDGDIDISAKGFRRKLRYWNSGKGRAFVLGNLHPHKEYVLYAKFTNGANEKTEFLKIAAFTVEDRGSIYTQLFLILITIALTLYFSVLAKSCGFGV